MTPSLGSPRRPTAQLAGGRGELAARIGTTRRLVSQSQPLVGILTLVTCHGGSKRPRSGTIGEYVERIFDESRDLPKYVIEQPRGWDDHTVSGAGASATDLPPVCILAGGLGSRLGERVRDTPKPLVEVAGEPFLFHQLRLLAGHGVRNVVLCVGYHGEQVRDRVGAERSGIAIRYSFDAPGLDGTLGAVRRALPLLGERFLVLYGDAYLRIDYAAVARTWRESGLPAVMTVFRNEGRWDTSNAVYRDGLVIRYDKIAPTAEMSWIDYGLGGLTAGALSAVEDEEPDLARLYGRLAALGRLSGYEACERFYEIGTPVALVETDAFLRKLVT